MGTANEIRPCIARAWVAVVRRRVHRRTPCLKVPAVPVSHSLALSLSLSHLCCNTCPFRPSFSRLTFHLVALLAISLVSTRSGTIVETPFDVFVSLFGCPKVSPFSRLPSPPIAPRMSAEEYSAFANSILLPQFHWRYLITRPLPIEIEH